LAGYFNPATLELMELENIVANTVYLKAREGGPGVKATQLFTARSYDFS
jgi:hypothetical protein